MFRLRENEFLRQRQIGNERCEGRGTHDRSVEERIIGDLLVGQMIRLEIHPRQILDRLLGR